MEGKNMVKMVRINFEKAGKSKAYRDSWIGVTAFYTTFNGDELAGTITHWKQWYPCVTFNDGTWARLDSAFLADLDTVTA